MPDSYLQIGAVAILFAIAIREFFGYLKVKRQGENGRGIGMNKEILDELKLMNNNHFSNLTKAINDGNEKVARAIHSRDSQINQILGEIKGNLNQRR